jgi:hypothetical protein
LGGRGNDRWGPQGEAAAAPTAARSTREDSGGGWAAHAGPKEGAARASWAAEPAGPRGKRGGGELGREAAAGPRTGGERGKRRGELGHTKKLAQEREGFSLFYFFPILTINHH